MKQPPDGLPAHTAQDGRAGGSAPTMRALGSILRMQTLVAVGLALGLLALGPVAAYSSLCGSLAVYLPGLLFTVLVGGRIGTSSEAFLGVAAIAEFGKLILTGVLCALVFIWVRPLAPIWFFAGMLTVLATGWVGLARVFR